MSSIAPLVHGAAREIERNDERATAPFISHTPHMKNKIGALRVHHQALPSLGCTIDERILDDPHHLPFPRLYGVRVKRKNRKTHAITKQTTLIACDGFH